MNKLFSILFTVFIFQNVQAQLPTPPPPVLTPDQIRVFAEVMPLMDMFRYPMESKKSFEVHTLDSFDQYPSFSKIKNQNLIQPTAVKKVRGLMKYVGAFPMPYFYDVDYKNQVYTHEVRVYFINASANDHILFTNLISQAEQIWNTSKISMDFGYNFRFKIVEKPWQAHYVLTVKDSTRGPYNINWGRDWTGIIVAHELGHMMGLADEYETMTGEQLCLPHSLMCGSHTGQLMKHHFYFILRRLVQ